MQHEDHVRTYRVLLQADVCESAGDYTCKAPCAISRATDFRADDEVVIDGAERKYVRSTGRFDLLGFSILKNGCESSEKMFFYVQEWS